MLIALVLAALAREATPLPPPEGGIVDDAGALTPAEEAAIWAAWTPHLGDVRLTILITPSLTDGLEAYLARWEPDTAAREDCAALLIQTDTPPGSWSDLAPQRPVQLTGGINVLTLKAVAIEEAVVSRLRDGDLPTALLTAPAALGPPGEESGAARVILLWLGLLGVGMIAVLPRLLQLPEQPCPSCEGQTEGHREPPEEPDAPEEVLTYTCAACEESVRYTRPAPWVVRQWWRLRGVPEAAPSDPAG
jgi:hypothetical protein